jgi:hypothetical protein
VIVRSKESRARGRGENAEKKERRINREKGERGSKIRARNKSSFQRSGTIFGGGDGGLDAGTGVMDEARGAGDFGERSGGVELLDAALMALVAADQSRGPVVEWRIRGPWAVRLMVTQRVEDLAGVTQRWEGEPEGQKDEGGPAVHVEPMVRVSHRVIRLLRRRTLGKVVSCRLSVILLRTNN